MFKNNEYQQRISRLRAAMEIENVDIMLVDESELLGWLTGYMPSETMYRAALVPIEGPPWYVVRALDEAVCRSASWFSDVIGHTDDVDPVHVIAESLTARGFGSCVIGADFDSYCFSASLHRRFAKLLPEAELFNLDGISGRIRAIKSEPEIGVITKAANIADETMAEIQQSFAPAMNPREAYAMAAAGLASRGADGNCNVGIIVKSSGDSEFLHAGLSNAPLHEGDVLHVELVPTVEGYGARLMRSIVVGEPDSNQMYVIGRLRALQDAQLDEMRPGGKAKTIDGILRNAVLGERLRRSYTNTSGYTVGLYGWTPRVSDFTYNFHPGSDWTLSTGMVFHMLISAQGLCLSETVQVTSRGAQRLTRTPRALLKAGESSLIPTTDS